MRHVNGYGGAGSMTGLLAATGFTFQVTPAPGQAPGAAGVQSAIDVIAAYALYASAAGFLLGAAIWAVGGRIGNDYTATGGKVGMFTSIGVAFAIGAAPKLLQWAFGLG